MKRKVFRRIVHLAASLAFLSCGSSASSNNRGNAAAGQGDYDTAIAAHNDAIKRDPTDAAAYYNRGLAYLESANGGLDNAIADFTAAISKGENNAEAYYELGLAYYRKGDEEKALANYKKAVSLDLDPQKTYYNGGLPGDAVGGSELARQDRPADGAKAKNQPAGAPSAKTSTTGNSSFPPGSKENPYDWTTTAKQLENADIAEGSWVEPQNGNVRQAWRGDIEWAKDRAAREAGLW